MEVIINFLNNKQLSAGATILTSVISALIVLTIAALFKSVILKTTIYYYNKCKLYLKGKYRRFKGKLIINDLIKLEEKRKAGLPLSKKEEKMLADYQQKFDETMSQFKISSFKIPNMPKF